MAFRRSRQRPGFARRDYDWLRLPPLPARVVMTDRADGTLWFVTFNVTETSIDGLGYISITDNIPTFAPGDVQVYDPNDGPTLYHSPTLKLLIRGGYLGYEQEDSPPGVGPSSQSRVMARLSVSRDMREIIIPTTWLIFGDVLGWTDFDLR